MTSGGSSHHADDFYRLAGQTYDSEEWETRHRWTHGTHVPDCHCFERDDEKRERCESWMCDLCQPGIHDVFLGCSECRIPWPCPAWERERRLVELAFSGSRRQSPTIIYPEKRDQDVA